VEKQALAEALDVQNMGIAMLASGGRITSRSSQIDAWLQEFFPMVRRRSADVPEELRRWLRLNDAALRPDGGLASATPYVLDRNGARLIVRQLKSGDRQILLFERHRTKSDYATANGLGLTAREAEIFALLVRDRRTDDIAHALKLSVRTVDKHLEHIYRKLGVRSRFQAVALARERVDPTQETRRPT
jgi:DNA-binding CsgD family transcriptional regulator